MRSDSGLLRSAAWLLLALTACAMNSGAETEARVVPGRIWDARANAFVTRATLVRAADKASVVLLGETHDNREHHRLQREVLESIVATGRRPALVMEQFDREYQGALDAERVRAGRTADSVLDAGHFNRRGWQVDGYRPLVEVALQAGLPIVAANLSRNDARAIVRDPAQVVLPPVNPAVEQALAADIDRSHCGETTPPAILAGMVAAQRARDLGMAQALEQQAARGAVLIAGIGHVRADRGAPLYMRQRPLVIAFMEVDEERHTLHDYFDREFATEASFDYVWFTARAERADPCAEPPALPGQSTPAS